MKRRTFLKYLAGGAAGVALSGRFSPNMFALGQSVPGVTDESIRLGFIGGFTDRTRSVEIYRGQKAVFDEVNAAGGIFGRQVELVVAEDSNTRAAAETAAQLLDEGVLAFTMIHGTDSTLSVLPYLAAQPGDPVTVIGPRTGAPGTLQSAYLKHIFMIRPTYVQEAANITRALIRNGYSRVGTFLESDSFGRSGTLGVLETLKDEGLGIAAEATCESGTGFDSDFSRQVAHLRDAGVEAVMVSASSGEFARFIMTARDAGWDVPVFGLSVTASALSRLTEAEAASAKPPGSYTSSIAIATAFPLQNQSLPGLTNYRAIMDKWNPGVPSITKADYQPGDYGADSLEGYVGAQVAAEALARAGEDLNRLKLNQALETIQGFDLGLGFRISFGPSDHQGIDSVGSAYAPDGSWIEVNNWSEVLG